MINGKYSSTLVSRSIVSVIILSLSFTWLVRSVTTIPVSLKVTNEELSQEGPKNSKKLVESCAPFNGSDGIDKAEVCTNVSDHDGTLQVASFEPLVSEISQKIDQLSSLLGIASSIFRFNIVLDNTSSHDDLKCSINGRTLIVSSGKKIPAETTNLQGIKDNLVDFTCEGHAHRIVTTTFRGEAINTTNMDYEQKNDYKITIELSELTKLFLLIFFIIIFMSVPILFNNFLDSIHSIARKMPLRSSNDFSSIA